MAEVELALAAILGTDLDMLFAALVIEAGFCCCSPGCAVRCACSPEWSHGRFDASRVLRLQYKVGQVAFLKRDADFRSRQQRQMQAVGVSAYGRDWRTTGFHNPVSTYRGQSRVDPVRPSFDMGVDVVLHRAGDPRRERVPAITGQGISAGR